MSDSFTRDELDLLREHGIVIFAERVIYEAQPPLAEARIAEIQALCSGPLPPGLLELWRITAGGRMDYDLSLSIDGCEEAISWCELFFDGSRRYNDLQGWIEHEQEITEAAAETHGSHWSGKLDYLPFGGFEYCDRIYVEINPGPDYGQVIAWKKGMACSKTVWPPWRRMCAQPLPR
ncbi:SMI1/KNR4 family protein [Dyella silvatica]|uniref:SMI1/KNR4 family protein n=1 Tax=Dyella silvatica TaxID=2992128 RepID=UPI00224CB8CF|nr:SMI1/KNR4 family protein [Dyella silvatica]